MQRLPIAGCIAFSHFPALAIGIVAGRFATPTPILGTQRSCSLVSRHAGSAHRAEDVMDTTSALWSLHFVFAVWAHHK